MGRTKVPLSMRIDPDVKALAERRAKETRRSLAAYVEWLILEEAARDDAEHIRKERQE